MPSCGVTAQLRCESSSVTVAGRESFTRNYLLRLSDDIFMWCRESAGRHSRVHFPYGDIRRKTHTQTHTHTHTHTHTRTVHRGVSVYCWQLPCVCVYQPCCVFKPDLSYMLYSNAAVRLHSFLRAIFIFANVTHNVCDCVQGGGGRGSHLCRCFVSVRQLGYNAASQYLRPSCGHLTAVLDFCKCIVSAFRMSLLDFFFFFLLHPFFYRNHCYKSYNHTRK